MRRLGRNWKRLHRLVYLAAGLAVLHFFLLVKGVYRRPLLYGLLLTLLLLVRIPPIKKALGILRDRLGSQQQ
jgi:sulfoxide reductase heme-binding subunit YedZ